MKKKWSEKCPVCNGELVSSKTTVDFYDGKVILRDVEVQYCPKCKQELFTPEQMKKVDKLMEGIHLQQVSLRRHLSESGRSLVLRIPADIARTLHLTKATEVELRVKDPKEFVVEVVA
ncbi:MAG: YgiT-type zinc finger protein [Candidatus Diapherotrites archaeon]|nr:YgiT-type zinc finger protein [Candidatus Diapherotrites archaeon]